jgi:hypothetical protein
MDKYLSAFPSFRVRSLIIKNRFFPAGVGIYPSPLKTPASFTENFFKA